MSDENMKFVIDETTYDTELTSKYLNRKKWKPIDTSKVIAFIPGTIREIFVTENQDVKKGDKLLILEAMKMKNLLLSDQNTKIKKILVSKEEKVVKNQVLIEFGV